MEVTPKAVNEVYRRVRKGESIRSVAEELKLDRKTLRKRMPEYLTKEQLEKIEPFLKPGRKIKEGSIPRGKKKEIDLSEQIKKLGEYGVTPKQIEMIFTNSNKITKLTKSTFIHKLLEIIELMQKRNESIKTGSKGFLSTKDIISMIATNPKIMTIDANRTLEKMLNLFDDNATFCIEGTNELIKANPLVLKNGYDKLEQGIIILSKFNMKQNCRNTVNLLDYCLQDKGKIFQVNTQKLFHRLCYFASANGSNYINKQQYNSLGRKEFKQGLNNITDDKLERKYMLPENFDNFDKKVQNIIDKTIENRLI